MKFKIEHLYGLISIIILTIIVIFFFKSQQTQQDKLKKNENNFSNFNEQVLSDKQKIKFWIENQPTEVSLKDLGNALVRVAQSGDEKTEEWMVLFSQQKNSELKISAAKAAGYLQNKKSIFVLKALTQDSDAEVRAISWRGLGKSTSPEAKRWLESKGMKEFKNTKEHIEWLGAQLNRNPTNKKIQALSKFIFVENNNEVQKELKRLAFERLLVGAPKSIKTQEILQKIIYSGKDSKMIAASIRHLAVFKNEWLNNSLKWLLIHENESVRAASVQSIHRLCPPNYWKMLKDVWDKDSITLKRVVLKEVQVLPGPEAISFLKTIRKNLNPELNDVFKTTDQVLQKRTTNNNPCRR